MNSVPDNDDEFNLTDNEIQTQGPPFYGVNLEGRVLSLPDEKELTAKRGFKPETLSTLRIFSATECDLSALGVSVPFSKLSSTIAIPFLSETVSDKTLTRIHKTSAEAYEYPPFVTPVPPGSQDIIIAESELKAAMAFQLGDQGVGLNGTGSFLGRVPLLANSIRSRVGQGAHVFVLPDHERLIIGGKHVVYEPTIQMIRLAYALSRDLGSPVKIITLPDRFLTLAHTKKGEPKVKADLDGCVAAGMTAEEWQDLKRKAEPPESLEIPPEFIVQAMAAANIEEFFDVTSLQPRLKDLSVSDVCAICQTLGQVAATKCYDADGNFDKPKFELYKKKAVEWAKKNGLKSVTSKNFHATASNQDDGQKAGLIAHCMRETERGVVLVKNGVDVEVVAPFTLLSCKYGEVSFPGAEKLRCYRVKIQMIFAGKPQVREIVLRNDLFNPEGYTQACPDLTIIDAKRFRSYVAEKLSQVGFQTYDPSLDQLLFTGLVQENGAVVAASNVSYPRGDEDCWYNNKNFPNTGDADKSFQQVAAITRLADVLFVLALGAPLKAILSFYPHGLVVARRYVGKTSVATAIKDRTKLECVSAKKQLGSNYRQLRLFGNHNLSVFCDECHRIDKFAMPGVLETLNTAYNGGFATNGTQGRYFISGCGILMGQDSPQVDEALDSKQVVLHLAEKDLDKNAVRASKDAIEPFPLVKWLEFLAANAASARADLEQTEQQLLSCLQERGVKREAGDRTILNYAAVMVSAKYLQRFGVNVQIDTKIVDLCALHISGKLHAEDTGQARSSAEKFVRDILNSLTVRRASLELAGAYHKADEGVWFRLTPWFDHLSKEKPDTYDEKSPARMGEGISQDMRPKGMINRKHTFGKLRTDAWLIPKALCVEMGYEFEKDDVGADDGTQID